MTVALLYRPALVCNDWKCQGAMARDSRVCVDCGGTSFMLIDDAEEIEVEVDGSVTPEVPASGMYGPPEYSDPGCGAEVDDLTVYLDKPRQTFTLTVEEARDIETRLVEDYEPDYGDDYEPDYDDCRE